MNYRKKIFVIINPVSGTKSKKDIPGYFKSLDNEKFDIQIIYTEYPGHATEIAEKAIKNKADYMIAVGGDGTINEVAKAMINSNVVLGIIPVGSGNGLARSLSIPMNKAKAINIISKGVTRRIDYGTVNNHIFLCTCGVGFDALVSEKSINQSKRGKLMYARNMFDIFRKFNSEKYKIETPTDTFETNAFVVTCANAPQYGNNAFIAPDAKMDDGYMNIAIIKPLSVLNIPKLAVQMFSKNIGKSRKMVEIVTPEVTIIRENEGSMHLDGNAVQAGNEIRIKIVRQGLNVLVPSAVP